MRCPWKSDTYSVFCVSLHHVGHVHHAQGNLKLKPCCLVCEALCDRFWLSYRVTLLIPGLHLSCPAGPSISPLPAGLIPSWLALVPPPPEATWIALVLSAMCVCVCICQSYVPQLLLHL